MTNKQDNELKPELFVGEPNQDGFCVTCRRPATTYPRSICPDDLEGEEEECADCLLAHKTRIVMV